MYSEGPYTGLFQDNTTKTSTFTIDPDACYTFVINDSAGDGICCLTGNGLYELRADDNSLGQILSSSKINSDTELNINVQNLNDSIDFINF